MDQTSNAEGSAPPPEDSVLRCLPLLSLLLRPGAVLMPPDNDTDPVAIVAARREGREQQLGAFTAADIEIAFRCGWIEHADKGWGWKIARAGVSIVRAARASTAAARAATPSPKRNQSALQPNITVSAPRHVAARDVGGSLAWLHQRRDKDGQPLISAEQLAAGERLAADLWRARMTPRVTAVWTDVPGDGSGQRSAPGTGIDIADTVIAAKVRVERALKAVGPELAGPLIDVCGHMLGLDDIERLNGLPMRSGKMLLRTALTQLARHYGYLRPEHGEAEIARRIAGWMSEDGGVTLDAWREDASPSPRSYGERG